MSTQDWTSHWIDAFTHELSRYSQQPAEHFTSVANELLATAPHVDPVVLARQSIREFEAEGPQLKLPLA